MENANELINKFYDTLDLIPHLVFEVGYTRPTGWMVHVWDSTGVSISEATKILTCQDEDCSVCFNDATEKLNDIISNCK